MTEASCRPARLMRFRDAHHAACDGLYRRCRDLDEVLATYRATCEYQYRAPTVGAVDAVDDWRGTYRAFATWVGDVGQGFLTADAVEAYMDGNPHVDGEDVSRGDESQVIGYLDHFGDDPYLGVPVDADGTTPGAPLLVDLAATDQDEPPPWVAALQEGQFTTEVMGAYITEQARVLANIPVTVDIVVRVEDAMVVVYQDGTIVARFTQTEVAARVVIPRDTSSLARTGRWLSRAAATAGFLIETGLQYAADDGLPGDLRVLRAVTRGGGTALGGIGGGMAGGAAAGLVCGPGAPVCSTVFAVGGGLLGAFGADWLIDRLPWMQPPDPLPLDYDLDAIEDGIAAGSDDDLHEVSVAVVDLAASEAVTGSVAPGSPEEELLPDVLPDRAELEAVITPPQPEGPPTGTTTTTTTTVPSPSPPSPGPAPRPAPAPATPAEPVPAPEGPPSFSTSTTTTVPGG